MLFAHEYGKVLAIDAGAEITQRNVRNVRTRVELGLAACERVVLDLRRCETVDSWGFLALFDLCERYGSRIDIAAPAYLRDILERNQSRYDGSSRSSSRSIASHSISPNVRRTPGS